MRESSRSHGVYLRTHGGTVTNRKYAATMFGLSPHTRRNRARYAGAPGLPGSISANAEEPIGSLRDHPDWRVYLRTSGGTTPLNARMSLK